jgi:CBS domain-containing protein
MALKIEDVMVEDVITVRPEETVWKAVGLMNRQEIGCLVVVKNEGPVGIVTERDILGRAVLGSKNPVKTKISEIMTRSLVVGKPDMEIIDAARLMFKRGIKKLPVVEGGCLVGLVTLTDLVYSQEILVEMVRTLEKLSVEKPPKRLVKVIDHYHRIIGTLEEPEVKTKPSSVLT